MKGRVSSSTPLFGLPEQTQKGFALGWGSCLSCAAEFNLLWLMLSVRGLVADQGRGMGRCGGIALLELHVEAAGG